jgi:hypothetical protein
MESTESTQPTKKLILPVSSSNEFFDEIDHAVIELEQADIDRIKAMSEIVKNAKSVHDGVYKIVAFDYNVTAMKAEYDEELDGDRLPLVEPEDARIECECVNVTDDDFFWTFIPKHTETRCETESVSISALDSFDTLDLREVQNG